MELIHNQVFRLLDDSRKGGYRAGLYRVIFDEPALQKVVCVCIQPADSDQINRGGRTKLETPKNLRKKPLAKLIGELLWMDRDDLFRWKKEGSLKLIDIDREALYYSAIKSAKDQEIYEHRRSVMASILDFHKLHEGILVHGSMGGLVREAVEKTGVSRSFVYKQWSTLCRLGINEISLYPRHDRCGAPGVSRPCEPNGRKKAGRKTLLQRMESLYGPMPDPEQPGMSSEWQAAIIAADKRIKTPVKPNMRQRYDLILKSDFVRRYRQNGDQLEPVLPSRGQYPNFRQVRRVLEREIPKLQRILEKTTMGHFKRTLRGLTARNWQDVEGPGHTWAIDSTIADVYLRSSINRSWIVGRPIVYIVVDVWSTAIVGFYVCLAGPSWNTAKISIFNSASDPALIGDLWGYQPVLSLNPYPTLCYLLLCDRGEYLSRGASQTAIKLLLDMDYTPPYRPDLKGLVEVLHRISKDEQFQFLPGAINARRAEFDLRKSHPEQSALTVRGYVQYLHEIFASYNLTADRSNRLDAHMVAAGVFPSPAGLWRWGHEMGIGFRRVMSQADLIATLLVSDSARVGRSSVIYGGNDYSCDIAGADLWTTVARSHGGWNIPVFRYPGSVSRIWTPRTGDDGLLELRISDQANTSPETTYEELLDVISMKTLQRPEIEHARTELRLKSLLKVDELINREKRLTAEADAATSGTAPTISEARLMEVASSNPRGASESKTKEVLRDDAMEEYERMMNDILRSADDGDATHG
ncbi:transposase [Hylemonella sp. W303a]|uniref:transposase n=1 Tax=Hylemonella sp. W303a TaxID=3389873 RepID=UPI00396B2B63